MILKVKYFCFFMPSDEDFNFCKIQDYGYGGRAVIDPMGLNSAFDWIDREHPKEQVREDNNF